MKWYFIEKYNDIALLADLMGHESLETTRIYLRMTISIQQKFVDNILSWQTRTWLFEAICEGGMGFMGQKYFNFICSSNRLKSKLLE
jgi:hypothetical protein